MKRRTGVVPRTELHITNYLKDGTVEVIEGLALDLRGVHLDHDPTEAEWGTSYPEFRDDRDPFELLGGDLDRGRTFFTLRIVAPLLLDDTGDVAYRVLRTTPGIPL